MTVNKKQNSNVIEDITYKSSGQSISRRVIYTHKDIRIKLEIQSDSYKGQCYARAFALDGLEWKVIYNIPNSLMHTREGLDSCSKYYINNNFASASNEFEEDVQTLKEYIEKIL